MKKNEIGITLIALVVTIIVLLIIAGISIATLTGNNGIIKQTSSAKEQAEISNERNMVDISAMHAAELNLYGYVVEENFKKELDKNIGIGKYDLEIVGEHFKVTYKETKRSYYVDKEGIIRTENEIDSIDEIYSEPGAEENIAPANLFDYEIVNDGEISAVGDIILPIRKARITRIKSKYCNNNKYESVEDNKEYNNTNYEIIYEGEKISDTLVIPYKIDGKFIENGIPGEEYTIVGVNLTVSSAKSLPFVETIIYPNTVKTITTYIDDRYYLSAYENPKLKKVVLPQNIESIPNRMFEGCEVLTSITIPETVTSIGEKAFSCCYQLKEISIPDAVTYIGKTAFMHCDIIKEVKLPSKLSRITENMFSHCYDLETVTIPTSVKYIDEAAFRNCSKLTTINYEGTEKEWNNIKIDTSGNEYFISADKKFLNK